MLTVVSRRIKSRSTIWGRCRCELPDSRGTPLGELAFARFPAVPTMTEYAPWRAVPSEFAAALLRAGKDQLA